MPIGIKKVGQISQRHIPLSIRRNLGLYEDTDRRLYVRDGDSEALLTLAPSCDNFSWTFHSWRQSDLWEDTDVQATDVEAEFIKNIVALQELHDLSSIEAPEGCRYVVDGLPTYDEDEDEDFDPDPWLDDVGEE